MNTTKKTLFIAVWVLLGFTLTHGNSYGSIWTFMPINKAPISLINKDGLQLVGLSKWSQVSTETCAEAVVASTCKDFAFSYMPFFNPADLFGNADVLNSLPNIAITETIFLGWREESEMKGDWSSTLATLRNRAKQVNDHINGIRDRVTKIVLIPVLEDYWSPDQWMQAVAVIASQLDSGDKVYFRRSGMLNTYEPPVNITATLRNGETYTFTGTLMEVHKIDFSGKGQVVSNDGGFVFQEAELLGLHEDAHSWGTAHNGNVTTSDWFKAAKLSNKTVLLHRPAYNLHTRTITNGYVSYIKPSCTLDKRDDSDTNPAFNELEAILVKQFLTPVVP